MLYKNILLLSLSIIMVGCGYNKQVAYSIQKCIDQGKGFVSVHASSFEDIAIVCVPIREDAETLTPRDI